MEQARPGVTARFIPAPARTATITRLAQGAKRHVVEALGGRERTRTLVVLAAVGGLASADAATVGASAAQLRHALSITNTDIGLLVTLSSTVAAVASVPFGMLADRVSRTKLLASSIVLWGAAMLWSASAGSFGRLLLARLALGIVTASAGPTVASLVGDYFPSGERGRIWGFISLGDLIGAGLGFVVTGDIAALSWRAAFVVLALPAFGLAWFVFHLHEPRRGEQDLLPVESPPNEQRSEERAGDVTGAQRLALEQNVQPNPLLIEEDPTRMTLWGATRFVLRVRTNILLIVSGACAYYFFAGMQTFGLEFTKVQFSISTLVANLLMLVVGAGAVLGVLLGGQIGDALLRRGRLDGRILVAAIAGVATAILFVPVLVTHSVLTALPYVVLAAAALSAQNPPIDAARLDIMPSALWGRAEGVRTLVRTAAQAMAPLVFGGVSDLLGGGHSGLLWTFAIMLLPLAISALLLFRARRSYPVDVASAAALATSREAPP